MGFAFAFPLVQVVRDSFYAGSFDSPIWVGLDNYKGVIDDPEFRQPAQQRQADAGGARDARARPRDRARAERPHPRRAPLPVDRLPSLRAAGGRDRHRVLVPAAGERRAEHGAARRAPGLPRARLAGQLAPRDRLGRRARRLAAARLRRRRVHGRAARAPARDGRGGAHRRRRLVEPAVARARAADPPDHRAARR